MSTPGDIRRPSSAKPSATPADGGGREGGGEDGPKSTKPAGKPAEKPATRGAKPAAASAKPAAAAAKSGGAKPGAARPVSGKGAAPKLPAGKGRKPFTPVKVAQERNWGPIMMFAAAGVVALLIVGFAGFQVWKSGHKGNWQAAANGISGIINFRTTDPDSLKATHEWGPLTYKVAPPVGGTHNYVWQSCMGDVYTAPIPDEQAVHSLEHGAVWITYRPDLPKDQVDRLVAKVRDRTFMMISPYPDLDKPISLQAWGYQLKVDNANDKRIDEFIQALRQNATLEPQAGCSEGITDTGAVPLDLGKPAATPAPPASPAG